MDLIRFYKLKEVIIFILEIEGISYLDFLDIKSFCEDSKVDYKFCGYQKFKVIIIQVKKFLEVVDFLVRDIEEGFFEDRVG